ncbi:hypothetical protein Salat_1798200 [Sesamum alatum]|uniref:Uncharacterized protein n=1 Tax=Sesamum alatum TaxID=300844 RepID=A0AAE1Y2S4_9LAMI|nr:hypothetical protein Salat_1798200 [Sesamum alatum]
MVLGDMREGCGRWRVRWCYGGGDLGARIYERVRVKLKGGVGVVYHRPTKYRSYVSGSECHKLEGNMRPLSSSSVNDRALPNLLKPESMEWHTIDEINGFGVENCERKQNSSKCIHCRNKPKTEKE